MQSHSAWRPAKYGDRVGNVSSNTVKKSYGKFGELMNENLSSFVYCTVYNITYMHPTFNISSYNTVGYVRKSYKVFYQCPVHACLMGQVSGCFLLGGAP
jgi:hypothetical protein